MSSIFTCPDTWLNGYYELAIELGPRSDERLLAALKALWSLDGIDGPYERRDVEPYAQARVEPMFDAGVFGHLQGVVTLPDGAQVACGTCEVREEEGSDWLMLYFPMGSVERIYDVGTFQLDGGKNAKSWRAPLDQWLAEAAQAAFHAAPFQLALIGHEVSGMVNASELEPKGVPIERGISYLWREGDSLVWYEPTQW